MAAAVEPYYVGYVLTSWNELYGLFGDPSAAFRAPYASEMASLFSGRQQDGEILAKLPDTLSKLLTARYYRLLQHPAGKLLSEFRANDTCWTPDVPVEMFAARGDTTVSPANALQCAAAIRAHGGHIQLTEFGDVSHDISDFLALPRILRWFEDLTR